MRRVMADAEVGDDVYGEDPSVNRLQKTAAELTGKQAALYVSSGSMGNLISIFIHSGSGGEVLTHKNSHIIHHELSSASALAGSALIGLDGPRGKLTAETLSQALRPGGYDSCRSSLIEIENTISGVYYREEELKEVYDFARRQNLPVHIDGARLFNAALASGMTAASIAKYCDSVTFCLSKGLGAPVGSVLCGSREFIEKAKRFRKMLGGGLRQSGIIAAAGVWALENNIDRLKDDHRAAVMIAEALEKSGWAELDREDAETNIIYFRTPAHNPADVVTALEKRGVLCFQGGPDSIRMVTSLALEDGDAEAVCRIISGLEI